MTRELREACPARNTVSEADLEAAEALLASEEVYARALEPAYAAVAARR